MYLDYLLKKNGYEIIGPAATGKSAIASVEENDPDLVLMDINLRDSIDGIEVTNILREKYNFPVIFISGYDDDETLSRITPIVNAWKLTKPVVEETLIDLIEKILVSSV